MLLLLACAGGGDATDDTGGGSGETGLCAEAPVVTFETFGAGFITENCQACHASTAPNRNGAPEEVFFDDGTGSVDVAQTWLFADRILERAAVDPPTMPPLGGTTADDRYRLEVWLTCAEPGT